MYLFDPAGPFAGALCRRWGSRVCTMVGGVMLSMGLFLTAFSPNLVFIYFSVGIVCGKFNFVFACMRYAV